MLGGDGDAARQVPLSSVSSMFSPDPQTSRWKALLREPEFAIAQLILWLFVGLAALQVTMRYAFDAPLTWPEELSQILLVWMTFIAAVGLSRQQLHIRVELFDAFLGRRGRQALEALFNVLTIVFMAYLIFGGWQMYEQMRFERTAALRLELRLVYAIVPISAAAMLLIHLTQLLGNAAAAFGAARRGP